MTCPSDLVPSTAPIGQRMAEVIRCVGAHPDGIGPTEVAAELRLPRDRVTGYLTRAVDAGLLHRLRKGVYAAPEVDPTPRPPATARVGGKRGPVESAVRDHVGRLCDKTDGDIAPARDAYAAVAIRLSLLLDGEAIATRASALSRTLCDTMAALTAEVDAVHDPWTAELAGLTSPAWGDTPG